MVTKKDEAQTETEIVSPWLMSSNGSQPQQAAQPALTPEVLRALAAPVPPNEIKTMGKGGATIRFTSDKFVIQRLDSVVGIANWSDVYVTTAYPTPIDMKNRDGAVVDRLIGTITCSLTVLGVTKSSVTDLHESTKYGSPTEAGRAKVLKHAAMKFGVARELWPFEAPEDADADIDIQAPAHSTRSTSTAASTRTPASQGNFKPPSEKQLEWLTGSLLVPASVASKLNAWVPQGGTLRDTTASRVITALAAIQKQEGKDAYAEHAKDIYEEVISELAPSALGGADDEDKD